MYSIDKNYRPSINADELKQKIIDVNKASIKYIEGLIVALEKIPKENVADLIYAWHQYYKTHPYSEISEIINQMHMDREYFEVECILRGELKLEETIID